MNKLIVVALLGFCQMAFASGEDLVNCLWKNGTPIDPPSVCEKLRQYAAEDRTKELSRREQEAANEKARAAEAKKKSDAEAVRAQQAKLNQEQWLKEDAARKEMSDKAIKEQQEWDAKEEAAESAREKKCGGDYRSPKIGMTLKRAKQCIGDLTLTKQLNRADGVISTYEASELYLHVLNGRVVSWGRF